MPPVGPWGIRRGKPEASATGADWRRPDERLPSRIFMNNKDLTHLLLKHGRTLACANQPSAFAAL